MSVRRALVSAVAALLPLAFAFETVPAHASVSPVAFGHTVLVDPQGLGGEPTMEVDSKGNIYISSIIGFSNHTSFLYKSEDGGESFDRIRLEIPTVQRPDETVGGGDTALIVGPPAGDSKDDTVIFIDLEGLVSFGSGTSFDGGNSFVNNDVFASGSRPGGDRQWGGWWKDPQGVVHYYNFFNALESENGGFTILETKETGSKDAGATWTDWKRGVTVTASRSRPGPLFVDQKTGDLYLTWTIASGNNGGAGFTRCTQQKVCTDTVIATQKNVNTNNTFAAGAMDRQGNLYVVWSAIPVGAGPSNDAEALQSLVASSPDPIAQNTPTRVYLSTSTNKGRTWSKPVVVSKDFPVASMPAIAAGDAGRVDVVYYATKTKGDPNFNFGPWFPYMSQSLDALSADPQWTTTQISEHTNHINPICTGGIGCTADVHRKDDRNLIDFFTIRTGLHGEALVTWNDTAHQVGVQPPRSSSFTEFSKQTSGPSLFADVGDLVPDAAKMAYSGRAAATTGGVPSNWTTDAIGDDLQPRHGIGDKQSVPSLDLEATSIKPAASPGTMEISMKIRDLEMLQTNSIQDRNMYMVWWWADDKVHYAAADIDSTTTPDCYAGAPSLTTAASPRWALYPRLAVPPPSVTTVPCTLERTMPGTITLDVPYSAVDAHDGQTLYSVHASTYHYTPPAWGINASANLMDEIDQTAPFTYVVGTAPAFISTSSTLTKKPVVKGKRTTRSLPATGDDASLAFGIALAAFGVATARRLRRS